MYLKSKKGIMKCSVLVLALCLLISGLCGCQEREGKAGTKVVFTTGIGKDEVFRIGDEVCRIPELMVYLTSVMNQYESVYGKEIWNTALDGVTLEENVKETVLERLAQIKIMYMMAKEKGIELDETGLENVDKAAKEYFAGLGENERELMGGITQDIIYQMYLEYASANQVYQEIIRDVNPEISDDEARTITVQHILIKTYNRDASGNRVEFNAAERSAAYEKAKEIRELATDGEHEFAELASKYSDDTTITYSFGKGEMDQAFEDAAFMLETDEVSQVVASDTGYHIIKCLNTFNREQTDANKQKIVEERRREVFGQEYDSFVENLVKRFNKEVWDEIESLQDKNIVAGNFFEIYDKYIGKG